MNCIEIKKDDVSYIKIKKDVKIIFLKNKSYWICDKNNAFIDLGNGFIRLNLAKKEVK